MNETPLISVIIPAHNSSATIGTAIASILDQTYTNLEIIVVDDNSTDNTKAVVEAIAKENGNVFYYSLPYDDPHRFNSRGKNINAGYMARNFGFEKVRGEWITFQDADDASLRNRIEVQLWLAEKYESVHVCVDWQQYDEHLIGKQLDVESIFRDHPNAIVPKETITQLARETKGAIIPFLGKLNASVPFEWKRLRFVHKLFFGSLAPYPGTGNSPLFKREVIQKVQFRPLPRRIWPSFMGRGADRDFNFQVAETFRSSMVFNLPLYLWRQKSQNPPYEGYVKYLR